jgi:hypothetical protein
MPSALKAPSKAQEVAALKTVLNTPLLGAEQHLAVGTPMSRQRSSAPVATDGCRVEDLMPFLLEPRDYLIAYFLVSTGGRV